MDPLTLFGVMAVSAMLLFYAFEARTPAFVLLFAGACLASSAYGFLQGAWPFGVVEAVWTGVAVRRWRGRVRTTGKPPARPIACDMSALEMALNDDGTRWVRIGGSEAIKAFLAEEFQSLARG